MTTNTATPLAPKSLTAQAAVVFSMLLASAMPAMAQSDQEANCQRPQWGVVVGASANSSTEDIFKTKPGFYLGATYDIPLASGFTLQPQLLFSYSKMEAENRYYSGNYYSSLNDGSNISSTSPSYNYEYDKFSLTLPVLATYRIGLGSSWGLRLSAGPYLQYDMFGHDTHAVSYADGKQGYSNNGWWHQSFGEHFSWGAMGGVAIEHGHWSIEARYKRSLRKNTLYFDMGHEQSWILGLRYKF